VTEDVTKEMSVENGASALAAEQRGIRSCTVTARTGVHRNLETENRRVFLRNIQTLRQALKGTGELVVD
jgi:hypothetical protein